MDFLSAWQAMRDGKRVTRRAWESGCYVQEEKALVYRNPSRGWCNDRWSAGHDDMFADDWVEVTEEESDGLH